MTAAEAREFIAEARRARGVTPSTEGVGSVEELLVVLEGDQVDRFDAAEVFLEGKSGIEVSTLRASLELSRADLFSILTRVCGELGARANATVTRLERKQASGVALAAPEEEQLRSSRESVQFLGDAELAVKVLARDHLSASGLLVEELLRRFPRDERTYRIVAFHDLLKENWERYDQAIDRFRAVEQQDAGLMYLRAGEALRRANMRPKSRELLAAALAINPKLVRAQAKLVLIQEDIDATHAELEKLRTLAPSHPIVTLAGPTIDAEYGMATDFRASRGEPN